MNKEISISIKNNLLSTLKQMDENKRKLLIVEDDDGKYQNLISIGDIQRAIISGVSLDTPIEKVKIDKKEVAGLSDSLDKIKERMRIMRSEFMPVIDNEGFLVKIYYWEDFFSDKSRLNEVKIDLPVVIMAGGKGTRLKPISNIIPKALIPIGEKTILETIMDRFENAGCKKFILSVNYKADMIQQYFNMSEHKYDISYFIEEKPLGTAGSLFLLKDIINSTFFVSNCDILIDQDFGELLKYHRDNKNEITMVAALKHYKIPYGTIISGENGLLESMDEKPELTFKINSGLYILEPHLLNEIPKDTFFHITELIANVKARNGRVGVFPVSEKSWVDIGEWPEYVKTVRGLSNTNEEFIGLQ
jgi:dTDP-glucose pyrophosphorylase